MKVDTKIQTDRLDVKNLVRSHPPLAIIYTEQKQFGMHLSCLDSLGACDRSKNGPSLTQHRSEDKGGAV